MSCTAPIGFSNFYTGFSSTFSFHNIHEKAGKSSIVSWHSELTPIWGLMTLFGCGDISSLFRIELGMGFLKIGQKKNCEHDNFDILKPLFVPMAVVLFPLHSVLFLLVVILFFLVLPQTRIHLVYSLWIAFATSGGMNGSIVYELDRPENTGLQKSLKASSLLSWTPSHTPWTVCCGPPQA